MKITPCELPGLLCIEPTVFGDPRGFFVETWSRARYRQAGVDADFVQDNLSFSRRGTLRGLHFQNPGAQTKLVSVLQGELYSVTVDLRRSSPTFGRWHGLTLSEDNHCQLYIPIGFANGFLVLSETALFHYKCGAPYSPEHELAIRWNDPNLGIQWPAANPLLSVKDAAAPLLRELPHERLFA